MTFPETNYPELISNVQCVVWPVKVTAPPMWPMLCIRQQLAVIYQPGHKPQATKAAAQPGAQTKKKKKGGPPERH